MNKLEKGTSLSGKPNIQQLKTGFKYSVDSLILADSVKVNKGESLLDAGSGVGTASIYATYGVTNVKVTAVEIDELAANLAILNYRNNNIMANVHCANFAEFNFNGQRFDYVITNPPFYKSTDGRISPTKGYANHEIIPLEVWVKLCLKRVKPCGIFSIIHTVDRLGDILSAINRSCWGITVIPISFQIGQLPKRVLITAKNGSRTKLILRNPLIVQ